MKFYIDNPVPAASTSVRNHINMMLDGFTLLVFVAIIVYCLVS